MFGRRNFPECVRAFIPILQGLGGVMEIDSHTLRKADEKQAIEAALARDSWVVIGLEDDPANVALDTTRALIRSGRKPHLICPRCSMDEADLFQIRPHVSLLDIDEDVEVIYLVGEIDLWDALREISMRMERFGDIKVVWAGSGLADERWAEDLHDFGFAVVVDTDVRTHL